MAGVTLRGIRKRYDTSNEVIKGVDLEVQDGEFMVFVGPSGCGKSTMMRMIAGLEDITEGDLRIGGKLANDVPPSQRGVAMVFQSYALYPHMTVAENMGFSLRMANVPKDQIRERVHKAAEILQIQHVLERMPKALSGGQRQRVAIGRAIVRKPGVFLFDEPLSNLDAGLRVQMRVELTKLHRELGSTMIYVTHDQTEAMTMGDRIAVFNQGRLEQVGPPMDLYQQPANRFVAQFLGSPRMNVAPGTLTLAGGLPAVQLKGLPAIALSAPPRFDPGACASIGVRPESLEVGATGEGRWSVPIEMIEHLGDTTLLYLAIPGHDEPFCAKVASGSVPWSIGEKVGVRPAANALYAFSASGGCLGIV